MSTTTSGGTLAADTLTLQSSSVAANASNTDAIFLQTSNGLTLGSPLTVTGGTAVPSIHTQVDTFGRFLMTVNTPVTDPYGFTAQHPLGYTGDTALNVSGTYTAASAVAGQMSTIVWVSGNAADVNAFQATCVATGNNSGGAGAALVGVVDVTGGIAKGAEIEIDMNANGTGFALHLISGGDNTHAPSCFWLTTTNAAGNAPNNGWIIGGNSINPIQSTGSIVKIDAAASLSVTHGIDFTNGTFSSTAFASPGFQVDGTGVVSSKYLQFDNVSGAPIWGVNAASVNNNATLNTSCGNGMILWRDNTFGGWALVVYESGVATIVSQSGLNRFATTSTAGKWLLNGSGSITNKIGSNSSIGYAMINIWGGTYV